jgi:hypothetical protein
MAFTPITTFGGLLLATIGLLLSVPNQTFAQSSSEHSLAEQWHELTTFSKGQKLLERANATSDLAHRPESFNFEQTRQGFEFMLRAFDRQGSVYRFADCNNRRRCPDLK